MMHFATPAAFLLLLLFPFVLEGGCRRWVLRGTIFSRWWENSSTNIPTDWPFVSPVTFSELRRSEGLFRRSFILNTLRLLTFLLIVTALARPQTSSEYVEVEMSGRDILLALDVSGSMLALDFTLHGQHVERLRALQAVVTEFVEARKGDRMGLVIFGSEVFTQCPLTTDYKILIELIDRLEVGMVGDGTAMGDGVALAVKRIREIPGDSKVIVLVTDGVKTAGAIDPVEAAQIAKKENIRIYSIGIGGTKPAPFRVRTPFGDTVIQYQDVPLDKDTLQKMAEITGGQFFSADKTDTLRKVYEEINKREERIEQQLEHLDYQEWFMPFVLAALALFLIHELLAGTRYLVVP